MPNLLMIPLNKIKTDPNQPRKVFSDDHINGLAQSMSVEGLINPIELDENSTIITGECRYRAAKQLGWSEIPAQINSTNFNLYERLRHQIAENVHQSGADATEMNPIDVAFAFARLVVLKAREKNKDWSPGDQSFPTNEEARTITEELSWQDKYGVIKEVVEEVGMDRHTITEYFQLLRQPEFVIKDIQENDRPRTYYREANNAPEEVKKQIKEKIAQGDYTSREQIIQDVQIAKKFPELAQSELLREKAREDQKTNNLLNRIIGLGLAMEAIALKDTNNPPLVTEQLEWISDKIFEYLGRKISN